MKLRPIFHGFLLSALFAAALGASASALRVDTVRYAAIGDSYSIGEGATPAQSWPALLAKHLTASGHPTELVANPSRTGWTTQQALDEELPVFIAARPQFATLQIGVNDWVQEVPPEEFRNRLGKLLDGMLAVLPGKGRLLVVTIPDFSVTPAGSSFGEPRAISRGIAAFNSIIRQESDARGLAVADVFPLSRGMEANPALVAEDGLHPSAAEYARWENLIFPEAARLLAR